MRRIMLLIGLLALLLVVISQFVQSQSAPRRQPAPDARQPQNQGSDPPRADRAADDSAIRANVEAFVSAYNAGDAKAVAALFSPDGLAVDKDGNASQGRRSR